MADDIRNTELKTRVKETESTEEAITRYMVRNGFETETFTDGKGLTHRYFSNNEYSQLWIGTTNFNGKSVTFTIEGNK
jgi:hypothetical protein